MSDHHGQAFEGAGAGLSFQVFHFLKKPKWRQVSEEGFIRLFRREGDFDKERF